MAELITPGEKVRDLAIAPRRIPIEVEGSVAFELILTLWSTFNPKDSHTAYDLGEGWHDQVKTLVADDLAEEIMTLGGPYCAVWLGIASLLMSAPHPHDPEHVYGWLETVDDKRLRRWLLGYSSENDDQSLIEQAAGGDLDAAIRLLGDAVDDEPGLIEYLQWMLETEGLPGRYASILKRFRTEVFANYEEEFAGSISRAAAARRAAPVRGDAKAVIEEVTSGLAFDIPLGITRVVLVPSVVTRPLSLVDANRGTLIVYYGIPDEFINSDPEAPPSWLVRIYKALSDEKRLRIMRRISEGEASLDELTELLGLSKSTVHHHINQLRGAGLIRVQMSADKHKGKQKIYSLREQSLADAGGFLDSYLRTDEQEQRHA